MAHNILFYLVFWVIKAQLNQLVSMGKGGGVTFPISISVPEWQLLFYFSFTLQLHLYLLKRNEKLIST